MGTRPTRPIQEDDQPDVSPPPPNPTDPALLAALHAPPDSSPQPPPSRANSGLEPGALVARKWQLLERVGRGAFGDIFIAECVLSGDAMYGQQAAVKVEKLEIADEATVKAALAAEKRQRESEALRQQQQQEQLSQQQRQLPQPSVSKSSLQPHTPITPSPLNLDGSRGPPSPLLSLPAPSPTNAPLPSEPLSPLTPLPASPFPSASPSSSASPIDQPAPPPVYMKRCIVKMEALVLSRLQHCAAFPRFLEYGRDGPQQVAYLAMSLHGDNLLRLRRVARKQRFSLPTVLRFGLQALRCLEVMHEAGFIHRDVKPSNFVIGRGIHTDRIYLIDFGLARQYRDKSTNTVMPPRKDIGGFRGTPRYASVYVHREEDLSRRDDLWSLLYILVEFTTGDLPWGHKRDKASIGRIKERYATNGSKLLKGCPSCFALFYKHLHSLTFESRPDYAYLYSLLENKAKKLRVPEGTLYDWEDVTEKNMAITAHNSLLQQQQYQQHQRGQQAGKHEEESKEADLQPDTAMRIVLHPHVEDEKEEGEAGEQQQLQKLREEEKEQSPRHAPGEGRRTVPSRFSMDDAAEESVQLGASPLPLGLGGRQVSASISLSYSPNSYSQQPLSSAADFAVGSPALSYMALGPRQQSLSTLPDSARDSFSSAGGELRLVPMYEAGVMPQQLLKSLDENQLNLRRKNKALSSRGSSSTTTGSGGSNGSGEDGQEAAIADGASLLPKRSSSSASQQQSRGRFTEMPIDEMQSGRFTVDNSRQ